MAFVEDLLVEGFAMASVEDLFEEEDLHSMALMARLVHLAWESADEVGDLLGQVAEPGYCC